MTLKYWKEQYLSAVSRYQSLIINHHEDNEVGKLLKWLIMTGKNPYSVFPDHGACLNSLVSTMDFYDTLNHSIYDDGMISFVQTTVLQPIIVLDDSSYDKSEDDFRKRLIEKCYSQYHKKDEIEIVKIFDNVDDYIKAYEKAEIEMNEIRNRNSRKNKS